MSSASSGCAGPVVRCQPQGSTAPRGSTPSCGCSTASGSVARRVERLTRTHGLSGLIPRSTGARRSGCPVPASPTISQTPVPTRGRERALARRLHVSQDRGGWLSLAAVQDAYSRRIVGWSMADHMRTELLVDALQMAVSRHRPGPGLIRHCDQCGQYGSLGFGQECARSGIARSTGSTGICWVNAVAETFSATRKKELVYRSPWPTRRELPARPSSTPERSTTPAAGTPPWAACHPSSSRKALAAARSQTLTQTQHLPSTTTSIA